MPTTENLLTEPAHYKELRQTGILPEHIISGAMIDKIKYIAAYQVAPVPGITHIAEVDRIEKYNDTDKYIVYFKDGTTQKISAK